MATSLHSHRQWTGEGERERVKGAQLAWFLQDSDYSLHLLQLQKLSEQAGQLELQLSWFLIANCWQVNLEAFLQVLSTYLCAHSSQQRLCNQSSAWLRSNTRGQVSQCSFVCVCVCRKHFWPDCTARVCHRETENQIHRIHSRSLWRASSSPAAKQKHLPPTIPSPLKRGTNWTAHFLCKGKTTTKKKNKIKHLRDAHTKQRKHFSQASIRN